MIKLLALDLDGTLLDSQKQISPRNKEAIKQAEEKGVKVVLTTGRPLAGIRTYLEALALNDPGDYAVTYNGGLVQENDTGRILSRTTLTLEEIQQAYAIFQKAALPLSVLSMDLVLDLPAPLGKESLYGQNAPYLKHKKCLLSDLSETGVYNKMVASFTQSYLDEQIRKLPKTLWETFEVFKSQATLLEVLPKGVTKARGLKELGKILAIDASEMMAIGDEENDLSLIRYAGIGVAMENATAPVKAAANEHTTANDADGVARAIEKFIL